MACYRMKTPGRDGSSRWTSLATTLIVTSVTPPFSLLDPTEISNKYNGAIGSSERVLTSIELTASLGTWPGGAGDVEDKTLPPRVDCQTLAGTIAEVDGSQEIRGARHRSHGTGQCASRLFHTRVGSLPAKATGANLTEQPGF
jgi:hypothetical protein